MTLSQTGQRQFEVDNLDHLRQLFGGFDENLKVLMEQTETNIVARDTNIVISGPEENVDLTFLVMRRLLEVIERGEVIDRSRIRYAVELAREGNDGWIDSIMQDVVVITHRGKQIRCKTLGQRAYVKAIAENTVVFAIGPAGTGKTYLAIAAAVAAFKNKEIERIILTRPAVEAGEKLGFLPGDLQNKVDPYLRPLNDALFDMIGPETYHRLVERGVIEVAPLAYMRGRTLNEAFIILDEAQNTTSEQMKMFLTRFGFGSHVVITGDVTQTDLPPGKKSGLIEAAEILGGVEGIGITQLTARDIVRHELVQRIVKAYERHEKKRVSRRGTRA